MFFTWVIKSENTVLNNDDRFQMKHFPFILNSCSFLLSVHIFPQKDKSKIIL